MTSSDDRVAHVVNDGALIGYVVSDNPKCFWAFDCDGIEIGLFASERAAVRAVFRWALMPTVH